MNLINKIVITIIVIVIFYAIFLIYSDLNLVKDHLGEFKVEFLPYIAALIILGWLVIFYRWMLLLQKSHIKVPKLQNFFIFMSGFAFSIIPGKVGELIKSQLLKTKFDIPRTKTAPIIIIEQLYNLIGIVMISCIGIVIMYVLNIEFFDISNYIISIAAVGVIFILAIINSRRVFNKIFLKVANFRIISKYELSFDTSYSILKKSLSGKFLIISTILSSIFWIIEATIVYLVLLGFDVNILEFTTIIATYTSSILLGVASLLPMGIGVTESTLAGFFSLQGVEISLSLTVVIFIRIFTRWIGVGIGFVFLKMAGGFSANTEKIE